MFFFIHKQKEVYLNGGAGYVLSRSAVQHFVTEGLKKNLCESNLSLGTNEDVNMAKCLTFLGIYISFFITYL